MNDNNSKSNQFREMAAQILSPTPSRGAELFCYAADAIDERDTLQSQLAQVRSDRDHLDEQHRSLLQVKNGLHTQLTQAQEEITKLGKSAELDIATAKSRRLLLGSDPPLCNCLNEAPTFPTCREHPHKENCKLKRVWDASINLIDILFRNDQKWADKLTQAHKERDEAVSECASLCNTLRMITWDFHSNPMLAQRRSVDLATMALAATNCGKAFLERMKELESTLKSIEWNEDGFCPECNIHQSYGHAENCTLPRLLPPPTDTQKGECQ